MQILVNGETRTAAGGHTVLDLLSEMGLDPARVAIELDRSILKRPSWPTTVLRDGARLEIVQFVGGG